MGREVSSRERARPVVKVGVLTSWMYFRWLLGGQAAGSYPHSSLKYSGSCRREGQMKGTLHVTRARHGTYATLACQAPTACASKRAAVSQGALVRGTEVSTKFLVESAPRTCLLHRNDDAGVVLQIVEQRGGGTLLWISRCRAGQRETGVEHTRARFFGMQDNRGERPARPAIPPSLPTPTCQPTTRK